MTSTEGVVRDEPKSSPVGGSDLVNAAYAARVTHFACFLKGVVGVSRRLLIGLITVALALVACGGGEGGDAATTTLGEEGTPTTQAPVPSTEATTGATTEATTDYGGGQTVGIGDIPQECIDAFVGFLREIEPYVAEIDWDNASMADFEALGETLEPVSEEYEAETADSNCDDLEVDASTEESFQYMIDVASREAPGTVPYFEMIRDFAVGFGEGSGVDVSNDCETDIAAMQAIIDEGVSMQEVEASQLAAIGGLMTSISTNCTQERSIEFFAQEDVTEFMGG